MTNQEFKNKVMELANKYGITINDKYGAIKFMPMLSDLSDMRNEEIKLAKELFSILESYCKGYGLYASKYRLQCTDKYIPYVVCHLIEELEKYKYAGFKQDEDISSLLDFPSLSEMYDIFCEWTGYQPTKDKFPFILSPKKASITEKEKNTIKDKLIRLIDMIKFSIEKTEKEKFMNPRFKQKLVNAIQVCIVSYPSEKSKGAFIYDVLVLGGLVYDSQKNGDARSKYHCIKKFFKSKVEA